MMEKDDLLETKDELFSIYSDVYKDVNGFRPKLTTEEFSSYDLQKLRTDIDHYQAKLEVQLEREAIEELMAISRFEDLVIETIAHGAGDRATAIRWLVGEDDFDQMLYDNGILGSQYGDALYIEFNLVNQHKGGC